jgi:GT2 family glycosyltransferase
VDSDLVQIIQLEERDEWIEYLQNRNSEFQAVIAELKAADCQLRADQHLQTVQQMLNSRAWRLAKWLHDVARVIAPPTSLRRRLLRGGYRAARALPKLRRPEYVSQKARFLYARIRTTLGAPQFHLAGNPATGDVAGFPRIDRVDVSIVIPVFNHLRETIACLESIKASRPGPAYEVIVIDDGSTDGTERTLGRIEGLHYVRNTHNLGFIASCNRGAAVARGEYLLFLNNDTTVTDGWLDALVETFHTMPDTGLAGAKLIYPDGRLQEAGGVIWRDASGWNYGNGDDPDHPRFNFVREVDYCSGACIMVPRKLFHALDGFDSRYAPAYYEDTDLAFKIRDAGHKVIYQPMARIIHHEGLTSGKSLNSGVKAYQRVNQPRFLARWTERLETHPEPPDRPVRFIPAHGRPVRNRGQVLVIDHRVPFPDRDSGSFRMMEILRAIRRRNLHVTFVPDDLAGTSPYTQQLSSIGVEVIHHPFYRSVADCLEEHGREFKLAILSRCQIAARHMTVVKRLAPRAKIVFDTVDLHFKREERQAEILGDLALRDSALERRRRELRLALRADRTLVVSDIDQAILRAELAGLDVQVLSNIIPLDETIPPPFEDRRDIVFIGGFEHPPNADAVRHFAREVFPRVSERIPEATFQVIGPDPPPEVLQLASPQIRILGHVADVRPIFDRARVSVAPLRFGAGVKGKVNQSMALGVPTIVTPIAAEGMHLIHEENAMIADNPQSFAEALYRTWSSPELWQRLSESGRANIREHFSVESAARSIDALLEWAGLGVDGEDSVRGQSTALVERPLNLSGSRRIRWDQEAPVGSREAAKCHILGRQSQESRARK